MTPTFEDNTKPARQNLREFASKQVKRFMNPGKSFWQKFNDKYQNDHAFEIWLNNTICILIGGAIALLCVYVFVRLFMVTFEDKF